MPSALRRAIAFAATHPKFRARNVNLSRSLMKSVDNGRQRARRFLIGAACTSVIIGFVACSSSTEHKASPHNTAGGDAAGGSEHAAGAPANHQGGGDAQAGESSVGGQGMAAAGAGSASGEAGSGGEVVTAGQSMGGAAGEAAGGAGDGGGAGGAAGAGGAGGEPAVIDPICGLNMVKVGEYSLWCGKVNEHLDAQGVWQPDADCTSGCNVNGVGYCQKFYPTATAIVTVPQVGIKDWKNAGFVSGQSGACNDSAPDAAGISGQAACCAPIP